MGGCQAWCQVTGALGASRIFTNEGSKKEKSERADSPLGNGAEEEPRAFPSQQGSPGMGIPLSGEVVSPPGPPSAVATPSEAATPVGSEEHKHPLKTGTPRGSRLHPGGKPGAASEWEKQPPHGTQHMPAQSTAWGSLAGNLLTSHLRLRFREWTEVTGLLRPTKPQVIHRDQGEGRNA